MSPRTGALAAAWLLAFACTPEERPARPGDGSSGAEVPVGDDDDAAPEGPSDTDGDGVPDDLDCDDTNPERYPGADEVCDDMDNDCDQEVDEDPVDGLPGYGDADQDGYGAEPALIVACERSAALVGVGGDCDDLDARVHPGAGELCDGVDGDCDPLTTEDGVVSVGGLGYASLQDALDAAVDGDTLSVCDGTYLGSVVVPPLTLTLASRNGAAVTVLEGSGSGPVMVADDAILTLRGLSLTGGGPGGQRVRGGGLSAIGSVVTVEDCDFTDNRFEEGGAIGVESGALTVTRTTFTGNETEGVWGGGAISAWYTTLVVTESTFTANETADSGGGILAIDGRAEIVDSTFDGNVAGSGGGAVHLATLDGNLISGSTFVSNRGGYGNGGALELEASTTITDTVFDANSSDDGGAISMFAWLDVLLERVDLVRNVATSEGGALWVGDHVTIEVVESVVHENTAASGGGVDLTNSDDSVLVSVGTDWGVGPTDNTNGDVSFGFGVAYWFGAEDFHCDAPGVCALD